MTLGKPRVVVLEDGSFKEEHWNLLNGNQPVTVRSTSSGTMKRVLSVEGSPVIFNVKKKKFNDLHLTLTFKPLGDLTITLILTCLDTMKEYSVIYETMDDEIMIFNNILHYGIGKSGSWRTLVRDANVDLLKAQTMLKKRNTPKLRNMRLARIIFSGKVLIDEVLLSSSAHELQFKLASEWHVKNQDDKGGWPIFVIRKLANGDLCLKPGWYSAMAQGQTISLLSDVPFITRLDIFGISFKSSIFLYS